MRAFSLSRTPSSISTRAARKLRMSTVAAAKPELYYFPIRGRMEPIRLLLQLAKVDYEDILIDRNVMKNDHEQFPFAQVPRYRDAEIDLAQSNAITRHLGRKHNMYGDSIAEAAQIDVVLDGIEALRARHSTLIYGEKLEAAPKQNYINTHVDPASMNGRNGGAHWGYLDRLLKKNHGGKGFFVGNRISIADIQMFDLLDIHARPSVIGAELAKFYPDLIAYHGRIAAIPEIKAYLGSPRRYKQTNNNGLGDD